MRITSVDILELQSQLTAFGWRPVIIRINTDEGIHGYGEVGLCYGKAASAGFGIAKDFAELIIGMDPMMNEAIWEKLYRETFWGQGGGGVIFAGISGIDVALWDIRGKALDKPVYELLGGKTNERLRAYASQIQYGWSGFPNLEIEPERYAEAAVKAVEDGYDAVKVDPLCVAADGSKGYKNTGFGCGYHTREPYGNRHEFRDTICARGAGSEHIL